MDTHSQIWPFDIVWPVRPSTAVGPRKKIHGPRDVIPVLLQPSRPSSRNRFVFQALDEARRQAVQRFTEDELTFESIRSFDAGVIHRELWDAIRDADVVVVDITALNPNVLYELGVVAAIKGLHYERVMISIVEGAPPPR